MNSHRIFYQKRALAQAEKAFHQGEVPIGAVIVLEDIVIAESHNLRETLNDPLAHAEIIALQKASQKLQQWRLLDAVLYTTVEPCIMCCGAIIQARIKEVIYGCADIKAGGAISLYQILEDKRLNHRVKVVGGVLEHESRLLMQRFFESRRSEKMERCPSG